MRIKTLKSPIILLWLFLGATLLIHASDRAIVSNSERNHNLNKRSANDDDEYGADDNEGNYYYEDEDEDEDKSTERNNQPHRQPFVTTTQYTTVTGSCIPADTGPHYYTHYNNLQRYFQMGIYGPTNPQCNSPLAVCDPNIEWARARNHWTGIFFGNFRVGGGDAFSRGPLAIQGDLISDDYKINHDSTCPPYDDLDSTALVVGGMVKGTVSLPLGGAAYIKSSNPADVTGQVCKTRLGSTGPVDFDAYYTYWTSLSQALSEKMPTHVLDDNMHIRTMNYQPDDTAIHVFTFNTCNCFKCDLWPGLLSTPDHIFSGYDAWKGPMSGYPTTGTLVFNIPVDDGTTFSIDSLQPSINADCCRTIYNIYPVDPEGNYLSNGHITVVRNCEDSIRGIILAPQADIQDGETGKFAGLVIGDNYSWQNMDEGPDLGDWITGDCSCTEFSGCVPPPTPTRPPSYIMTTPLTGRPPPPPRFTPPTFSPPGFTPPTWPSPPPLTPLTPPVTKPFCPSVVTTTTTFTNCHTTITNCVSFATPPPAGTATKTVTDCPTPVSRQVFATVTSHQIQTVTSCTATVVSQFPVTERAVTHLVTVPGPPGSTEDIRIHTPPLISYLTVTTTIHHTTTVVPPEEEEEEDWDDEEEEDEDWDNEEDNEEEEEEEEEEENEEEEEEEEEENEEENEEEEEEENEEEEEEEENHWKKKKHQCDYHHGKKHKKWWHKKKKYHKDEEDEDQDDDSEDDHDDEKEEHNDDDDEGEDWHKKKGYHNKEEEDDDEDGDWHKKKDEEDQDDEEEDWHMKKNYHDKEDFWKEKKEQHGQENKDSRQWLDKDENDWLPGKL